MAYLNIDEDEHGICDNVIVFDLDTGKELDRCKWANDETGEYQVFIDFKNHVPNYEIKKGNIKIVYRPLNEE